MINSPAHSFLTARYHSMMTFGIGSRRQCSLCGLTSVPDGKADVSSNWVGCQLAMPLTLVALKRSEQKKREFEHKPSYCFRAKEQR